MNQIRVHYGRRSFTIVKVDQNTFTFTEDYKDRSINMMEFIGIMLEVFEKLDVPPEKIMMPMIHFEKEGTDSFTIACDPATHEYILTTTRKTTVISICEFIDLINEHING